MFADNNSEDPAVGVIRGRVVDSEKRILPGATIFIENLKTGVVSDANGFYTLTNLKPGTYKVKVSYVGYEPIYLTLNVPEGKTVERDITMNEGLELHEVVVGGVFQGQSRAINQQKSNFNLTNVVSADQVGKFPDSNIGDALKRISGINVQYDQGEARFGQVRGTSPDLTSVSINGNRLPSAEGDARNVQLDLIPSDMIQTIEVNKVVTADMDGDAIGGAINLITKNTPYRRVFNANVGTGYNWISDKMQLNLGLTYGDRFFNDKLGLMAAISYQNSPAGSDNTEFEYDIDDNDNVVLTDAEIRQYYVTRERQSYSLSLDYDFNPNHKIYFNGIYNRYRAHRGKPYYSLSQHIKQRVKSAVSYISDFETTLAEFAVSRRCDGIICGHIHHPDNRYYGQIHYLNSGDWVETMSALTESTEGDWNIVYYAEVELEETPSALNIVPTIVSAS